MPRSLIPKRASTVAVTRSIASRAVTCLAVAIGLSRQLIVVSGACSSGCFGRKRVKQSAQCPARFPPLPDDKQPPGCSRVGNRDNDDSWRGLVTHVSRE